MSSLVERTRQSSAPHAVSGSAPASGSAGDLRARRRPSEIHGDQPSPLDLDLAGADLRRYAGDKRALTGAKLRRARANRADLTGHDLTGADLRSMRGRAVVLADAVLVGADLSWADLRQADLRNADLTAALLTEADLSEADLRGADLAASRNLERVSLRNARADQDTTWPEGFDVGASGVRLEHSQS